MTGLPLLSTPLDTYHTVHGLINLDREVQGDDLDRMEAAMTLVSENIDLEWLGKQCQVSRVKRLSPPSVPLSAIRKSPCRKQEDCATRRKRTENHFVLR